MAKRPRFYFITPQFGRSTGGVGVSAERFVSLLRDACDFTVFTPDRELAEGTYIEADAPGLDLVKFGSGSDAARNLQFVSDLILHLHERRPAVRVLGFYAGDLSYSAVLTAGLMNRPFDVFLRGNDMDLGMFGPASFQLFETLGRAEQVFSVTRELAKKAAMFCPGVAAEVVPNGVDCSEFPLLDSKPAGPKPTLGLFGDIKAKKGLEFLLSSLDWSRFQLRIVGGIRPESAKMLQAFSQLYPESAESIVHVPFVKSVPELLREFGEVDLVCLPSHHEGMANVMLEAMSCGKILLCSAVGGALDVIRHGENGFLHTPRDSESFRRALNLACEALRSGDDVIRKAARATIEADFSWERERERFRSYYS